MEKLDDQNPGPKALTRSNKGQERREQRKCQARSDCQRSDVEVCVCVSGSLRGRRSEEKMQSNTSSPWGSRVPLESQRG